MSAAPKILLAVLLAGWLADLLAGKDRDVEAGVTAYEAGELETALSHFDAAVDRLGDRPELSFDRGLVLLAQGETDSARKAFEHASEAEDFDVRASAFYELGNVALDAEDYEAAIAAYIDCLKARPEHGNAKWNLELALLKRTEQEKEEENDKDEEEESEDEDGDESGGEESGGEESGGDDDTGGSDTGGSEPEGESGEQEGESGQEPPGESGEQEQGSGGEQEPDPDQGSQTGGEQEPPEQEPPEQPPPSQPDAQPLNQMDIDKALEDLDEQDVFLMDRPTGRQRKPAQDW